MVFVTKVSAKIQNVNGSRLGHNSGIAFGFYSKSKLQINKYEITL